MSVAVCSRCRNAGAVGERYCSCESAAALRARIDADPRLQELRARIDRCLGKQGPILVTLADGVCVLHPAPDVN